MGSVIHSLADVHSKKIGDNTTVWQFAIILAEAEIGENCNINCHTFIENKVKIGNNVTVKSGVYIWDGIEIENDVFIGPNVTFINDPYPRSKKHLSEYKQTFIRKGASIGAGSIIHSGITIGSYALIGAGANVTKNIPAYSLVKGNPAKICGWVDESGEKLMDKGHSIFENSKGKLFKVENNELIAQ